MKNAILPLLFLAACTTTESENIRTQGIRADISVQANDIDEADVSVTLRVGSSLTFLELSGSDALYADAYDIDGNALGATQVLQKSEAFGLVTYNTTFNELGAGLEGNQYVISFDRTGDVSAQSFVFLPASLGFLDVSHASVARGNSVDFEWSQTGVGGNIQWTLSGNCINDASGSVLLDDGADSVPGSSHMGSAGQEFDTCPATLDLSRTQAGDLDPAFGEGGEIVAIQRSTTTFSSIPQ